jgi:SAM-dependent methyltransferase
MKTTDRHWEEWGRTVPYYGVATDQMFKDPDATALDEFFRTGENHIQNTLTNIALFAPGFRPTRSMDFGCGTGRLLVPLSKLGQVIGVDVSPSMLAEARKNCDTRGIGSNAELVRSDDELSLVAGDFDLIHSHIVFQHIPVARGMRLADRLIGALGPRGVAALHFTYGRNASLTRKLVSWLRPRVAILHYVANRLQGQSGPPMQMNMYSLAQILDLFRRHRCAVRTVELTDHAGTLGAVFYVQRQD